jgi:hypothetical protein
MELCHVGGEESTLLKNEFCFPADDVQLKSRPEQILFLTFFILKNGFHKISILEK